ncbi:aldehyde dehydrogenase (NADP(+)) [Pseudonocardia sp. C8]|uniref:aldehyde dehydrogenase (NADP(+)) n=1 Tax=Pseudonocardia sp. C8 TaxID=2762759 RepID=UPI001643225F|nr:aldehyde dehydrogenase (NADP(+)) [Pseudonocardia sp. C8]
MTAGQHTAVPETTETELEQILDTARAAGRPWADLPDRRRAELLVAVADALDAETEQLAELAGTETGLPHARLTGEVKRTSVQLRMFAEEIRSGVHLDVILDRADPDFALGPRPDLRRYQIPVGPVLVFAASNFPFAFSVAGGDTAAALAAGCPVVVKAHSGHPRTSAATAAIVQRALAEAGAPDGGLALVTGSEAGVRALKDPRIAAAAFTGSVAGGRALADIAAARPTPIPFFGELGSLNPALVTGEAVTERAEEIAAGFVDSFTLGCGQFCTKPGVLLVPAGTGLPARIAELAGQKPAARMLTDKIAHGYADRLAELTAAPEVEVLVKGSTVEGDPVASASPSVLRTSARALAAHPEQLLDEAFGPVAVLGEYDTLDEVDAVLQQVGGSLTVTVHTGGEVDERAAQDLRSVVRVASERAGRIVFNAWPTGVAVTPAQHHGGPYPATTAPAHTSVGATAIRRFLRPVTYQNAPEALLPEPLQESNPLGVPRRIEEAGRSTTWGVTTG